MHQAALHGNSMYVYMNHGTEPCMHVEIKKVWTPTSKTSGWEFVRWDFVRWDFVRWDFVRAPSR